MQEKGREITTGEGVPASCLCSLEGSLQPQLKVTRFYRIVLEEHTEP